MNVAVLEIPRHDTADLFLVNINKAPVEYRDKVLEIIEYNNLEASLAREGKNALLEYGWDRVPKDLYEGYAVIYNSETFEALGAILEPPVMIHAVVTMFLDD